MNEQQLKKYYVLNEQWPEERMAGTTMARINGLELACMKNG